MNQQPMRAPIPSLEPDKRGPIQKFIEDEKPYLKPLYGVYELANDMECSRSTIYVRCMKEMSIGPKEILEEYRLKRALAFLRFGWSGSMEQLAEECGYNYGTFNRAFRRRYGATPTACLKQIRKKLRKKFK